MADLSNLGSDIIETVKDTVTEEVVAIGQSAKRQVLLKKQNASFGTDKKLDNLKRGEKIRRQKLLDQKIAELAQLRKTTQISAPTEKLQLHSASIPQLKRVEGWQTEVARHRQEVGASKGKG